MKKYLLIVLFLAISATGIAQVWPKTNQEAKAGTRWWWLGSAVDKENLKWNLEEYARAGIGAVEITPIYGVQGNERNDIDYLSPKWMEALKTFELWHSLHDCTLATHESGWHF